MQHNWMFSGPMRLPASDLLSAARAVPRVGQVLLALHLLLMVGCGKSDWGYVTGTVTVDGEPVGPGSLMFEPANPESITAPSAIAHFREDGRYELKSAGNAEGAPVGEYYVMIHSRGEEVFGDESIDPNQKSKIPRKYLNHQKSGLKATVKPGKQVIDFDLESS